MRVACVGGAPCWMLGSQLVGDGDELESASGVLKLGAVFGGGRRGLAALRFAEDLGEAPATEVANVKESGQAPMLATPPPRSTASALQQPMLS